MHTIFFGGSFDPVHNGHLLTAQSARQLLSADRLVFIPANISPLKSTTHTTGQDRLAMLQLAIAHQPHLLVDDFEITRTGPKNSPSFTIDTLTALRPKYAPNPADQLTFLMGIDQLPTLHQWRQIQDILHLASIALMGRPSSELQAGLASVETHLGHAIRQRLESSLLQTPLIDTSSTTIRNRLQSGQSIADLVPPEVAAYILKHRLYK